MCQSVPMSFMLGEQGDSMPSPLSPLYAFAQAAPSVRTHATPACNLPDFSVLRMLTQILRAPIILKVLPLILVSE